MNIHALAEAPEVVNKFFLFTHFFLLLYSQEKEKSKEFSLVCRRSFLLESWHLYILV